MSATASAPVSSSRLETRSIPLVGPRHLPIAALVGGSIGVGLSLFVTLRRLNEKSMATKVLLGGTALSGAQLFVGGASQVSGIVLFAINAVIAKVVADRVLFKPLSRNYASGGNAHESLALVWLSVVPHALLAATFVTVNFVFP